MISVKAKTLVKKAEAGSIGGLPVSYWLDKIRLRPYG